MSTPNTSFSCQQSGGVLHAILLFVCRQFSLLRLLSTAFDEIRLFMKKNKLNANTNMLVARARPTTSSGTAPTKATVRLQSASTTQRSSVVTQRVPASRVGKRGFAALSSAPCLVVAEHDTAKIQSGTLNTITAASQLSSEVTVLLAGSFESGKGNSLASELSSIQGVKKVVLADNPLFKHFLPEVYVRVRMCVCMCACDCAWCNILIFPHAYHTPLIEEAVDRLCALDDQ